MSEPEGTWAKPVDELHVADAPADLSNEVEGRRVAALHGGFGKAWQKHYRIALNGAAVTPAELIKTWRTNFSKFWPKSNRMHGSLDLSPGDVTLLEVGLPGGMKLSTGILVLYSDETSFSFISPEGHMFNGMITFSAREAAGVTFAHIDFFIRAQDPLSELGMMLGGHRKEDRGWMETLENLARHFGVEAEATCRRVLLDRRRQWRYFWNIKGSIGLRALGRRLRRRA